ncbi:hypothetical protein SDC9_202361 [bioreactor metagenome]|uniref:Uncharacterized protein n=1 Tax=bioreactor metagenome TaxID=1076179 RepID=A0A645J2H1_9ZZZZ
MLQIFQHHAVVCRGGMPAVKQLNQQRAALIDRKITVDQLVPTRTLRCGNLGIPVAGQINKVQPVNIIIIDRRSFTWGCADPCKVFTVTQFIDQRRFADIRTAGKYNFRPIIVRQL